MNLPYLCQFLISTYVLYVLLKATAVRMGKARAGRDKLHTLLTALVLNSAVIAIFWQAGLFSFLLR